MDPIVLPEIVEETDDPVVTYSVDSLLVDSGVVFSVEEVITELVVESVPTEVDDSLVVGTSEDVDISIEVEDCHEPVVLSFVVTTVVLVCVVIIDEVVEGAPLVVDCCVVVEVNPVVLPEIVEETDDPVIYSVDVDSGVVKSSVEEVIRELVVESVPAEVDDSSVVLVDASEDVDTIEEVEDCNVVLLCVPGSSLEVVNGCVVVNSKVDNEDVMSVEVLVVVESPLALLALATMMQIAIEIPYIVIFSKPNIISVQLAIQWRNFNLNHKKLLSTFLPQFQP